MKKVGSIKYYCTFKLPFFLFLIYYYLFIVKLGFVRLKILLKSFPLSSSMRACAKEKPAMCPFGPDWNLEHTCGAAHQLRQLPPLLDCTIGITAQAAVWHLLCFPHLYSQKSLSHPKCSFKSKSLVKELKKYHLVMIFNL